MVETKFKIEDNVVKVDNVYIDNVRNQEHESVLAWFYPDGDKLVIESIEDSGELDKEQVRELMEYLEHLVVYVLK